MHSNPTVYHYLCIPIKPQQGMSIGDHQKEAQQYDRMFAKKKKGRLTEVTFPDRK